MCFFGVFEDVVVVEGGDGVVDFYAFLGACHDAFLVDFCEGEGGRVGGRWSVLVVAFFGRRLRGWV